MRLISARVSDHTPTDANDFYGCIVEIKKNKKKKKKKEDRHMHMSKLRVNTLT